MCTRHRPTEGADSAPEPHELPEGRYQHLTSTRQQRPLAIARHLLDHGIQPKGTRRGYEREVWASQHEYEGHRR